MLPHALEISFRMQLLGVVIGVAVWLLPAPAGAQRQSGIQLAPDSARYLISKDVGTDRWAITYNLDDKTVTGNVFSTAGSAPQFVWCATQSVQQAAEPAEAQYTLRCQFAGPCAAAPCGSAVWDLSAPIEVTVPGSFLLPAATRSTLAGNVQPILNASCANSDACHADNRAPDLLPGRTWDATFGVPSIQDPAKPFVAAFDPVWAAYGPRPEVRERPIIGRRFSGAERRSDGRGGRRGASRERFGKPALN